MNRWRGVGCLTLALAAAAFAQNRGALDKPDVFGGYASDRILVRVTPGVVPITVPVLGVQTGNPQLNALAEKWHVNDMLEFSPQGYANQALADKLGLSRTYVVHVPKGTDVKAMIREFSKADKVELAELDGIGGVALTPNDPSISNCWGLNNTGQTGGTPDADIDAFEAWDIFTGYGNIILAVIDTGVDPNHPEMAGKMVTGWNTYLNNGDTMDRYAHGTHVAGTAGANGNNGIGLAGVSWRVRIMPVKCLSDGGNGTEDQCGAAMVWAADHGANICTMSLQYYTGAASFEASVNYAHDQGLLLIAATGNNQGRRIAFPAKFANCYAVGATTHTDARASFSNYGPEIDVSAPGENVYSCVPNNGYAYYSGTSMATPHTSGLASLIWSYDRGLTNDQVFEIIRSTAEDKGSTGFDEFYGWGRINAWYALQKATLDLAFPTNITLFRGNYVSGTAADVYHADGSYYKANGTMPPANVSPAVGVTVDGTSPYGSASKVQFLLVTSANKAGGMQRTELMNMTNGQWELVDARPISSSDNLAIINVTSNPNRFIGNGGAMKARISFYDMNPQTGILNVNIDQARWSVRQ